MADERQAAAKAAAQAAHQANTGSKGRQAYIVHVYDECWSPAEEPPGPRAAQQVNAGSKGRQAYVVHVYDECWAPVEEPPGTSGSARLDEIEQRLQQILGLLEKRGS